LSGIGRKHSAKHNILLCVTEFIPSDRQATIRPCCRTKYVLMSTEVENVTADGSWL